MKKLLVLLAVCTLLVCTLLATGLAAAEEFEGNVVAAGTALVTSPYGGTVSSVSVREGQGIEAGEPVAAMQTVKAYASEDGTVRGIFAQPGDDVTDAIVLYIAPVNQYEISCSTNKAYSSQEASYVRVGETVYIVYLTNEKYSGTGVVTSVDGKNFTVETTDGNLYLNKTVYIYRDAGYTAQQRIGSGTVNRVSETAVSGSGSLLKLYVQNGDNVKRGQLLFETVAGGMLYTAPDDGVIRADVSGIVDTLNVAAGDTVSLGDVLMTVVQANRYEIAFSIGEDMLNSVYVGQKASIVFNWKEDTGETVEGMVSRISYVSEEGDATSDSAVSETQYMGYITFEADDTVKLGMSVTVNTLD
jgi:biotin carboxyl carrier protein